ncbi:protein OCTOPUS-like [Andrographis paniculata]|uniref:protein OCTOPUS-like n=1 Tax=Andrographis paniculata TaxID=175694 RepID=UPI0021E9A0B8|nr:protein OCTOPUS-like [Andrographis paniculata]
MPLRTRARIRSGIRPAARRLSPCYRHPDEPITGICASCLRERLSGLDSSISAAAASPELRRSRSVVSAPRCEAPMDEQRRKSCDVVSARPSLSNLFDVADLIGGSETEARVESKNVGISRVTYTVIQSREKIGDEIRVSKDLDDDKLGESNTDCAADEEFKTMKEYIDLEFQSKAKKSKDLKGMAGNFLGAASVFTKKLKKWRQKNTTTTTKASKNPNNAAIEENVVIPETANLQPSKDPGNAGRRSCDTEPRFSIDGGRISFDEPPRASWDGYMIARTIPRLAPMFSVVEDGLIGNMNNKVDNRRLSVDGPIMHSIVEDESSSGAHSNSDSSSSRRQSSFDRSSSVRSFGKKTDHGVSPANVKLVITEKELKDWRLSSRKDDEVEKRLPSDAISGSELNFPAKKTTKWRSSVRNLFGFKEKATKNVNDDRDLVKAKLTRTCSSGFGLRNSSEDGARSYRGRRSVDNVDGYAEFRGRQSLDGMGNVNTNSNTPPFYMTPLRSLKNSSKAGNGKLKVPVPGSMRSMPSPIVSGHVLQLN